MQLPNSTSAYIQSNKLTGYLLSETHKDGKAKAKFFRKLGFSETNLTVFKNTLLDLARNQPVDEVVSSVYGTKYVIIGSIETPSSKVVTILTVWIIDDGEEAPRFITARPY